MDQVLLDDGRIIRIMGNFSSDDYFFGYNVYSPDPNGDRYFRGKPYIKNYFEENDSISDVIDTYEIFEKNKIIEFFDPISTAQGIAKSYSGTIWYDLYDGLIKIFGSDSVGLLGSALSGLHLRGDGQIRNDIDYFLEGLVNVPLLQKNMRKIREELGFKDYGPEATQDIFNECSRVIRNPNTTISKIIERRWSGMELPGNKPIRNTIRFRDKGLITPFSILGNENILKKNIVIDGTVTNAIQSNLYPRMFNINSNTDSYKISCLWWKLSSPVLDGDKINICGDLLEIEGEKIIRITNFKEHWLQLKD
jgi:predicted nucleotidyltransferase